MKRVHNSCFPRSVGNTCPTDVDDRSEIDVDTDYTTPTLSATIFTTCAVRVCFLKVLLILKRLPSVCSVSFDFLFVLCFCRIIIIIIIITTIIIIIIWEKQFVNLFIVPKIWMSHSTSISIVSFPSFPFCSYPFHSFPTLPLPFLCPHDVGLLPGVFRGILIISVV